MLNTIQLQPYRHKVTGFRASSLILPSIVNTEMLWYELKSFWKCLLENAPTYFFLCILGSNIWGDLIFLAIINMFLPVQMWKVLWLFFKPLFRRYSLALLKTSEHFSDSCQPKHLLSRGFLALTSCSFDADFAFDLHVFELQTPPRGRQFYSGLCFNEMNIKVKSFIISVLFVALLNVQSNIFPIAA